MQSDPVIYIPLTLLSALGFAAAAVLQQAEAAAQENDPSATGGLMRRLLTRPRWWLGMLAYVVAYGLQLWAVSLGPVVIIQPLIAAQLVFALLLGTVFMRRHADRREWLGAICVTLGLAGFIVGTDPSEGSPDATDFAWAVSVGVTAGLTALCLLVGARTRGAMRSTLYGTAAGLCWGFMIVLMKVLTHRMGESSGFLGLLEALVLDPFFYGLLVTAIGGFILLQKAFAAGSLTHALVSYTVIEIVLAVILGILLFGEQPHTDWGSLVVTGISSIGMLAGIFWLASSRSDGTQAT
ncbi:MAG: DMT family transporter [Myxococcota bacterium]|nr:DMT family transporter [Myxococcota bacterium]